MKKNCIFLFLTFFTSIAYTQRNSSDLPAELKDIAARAFEKIGPVTKQWFVTTARQHPAGTFDSSLAIKKLRERFPAGDMDPMGALFVLMLGYQKMMNKEAREDRRLASADARLELASKENKLTLDNKAIDQGQKEAAEKADHLMDAAQVNLWTGIIGGISQMAGGALQSNQGSAAIRNSPTNIRIPDSLTRNLKINNSKPTIQKTEQEKIAEEKKASEDRKKMLSDAVKKMQDQLSELGKHVYR